MSFPWSKLARPDFVSRHYRGIITALVLINTALIVFLGVYIWTYGLPPGGSRQSGLRDFPFGAETLLPVEMSVDQQGQVAWSRPGGAHQGAASRGILDLGEKVKVVDRVEFEGATWLEVVFKERRGWVPAAALKSSGG